MTDPDLHAAAHLPGTEIVATDLAAALVGWAQSGDDVAGSRPYGTGTVTLITVTGGPVTDVNVPSADTTDDTVVTVPNGGYLIWEHLAPDGPRVCQVNSADTGQATAFFYALPDTDHSVGGPQ